MDALYSQKDDPHCNGCGCDPEDCRCSRIWHEYDNVYGTSNDSGEWYINGMPESEQEEEDE